MLRIEHLNVWYGATEVLRDVSFTVPDRTVVALLGGNGAGKTTLLKTLSGMVQSRSGEVWLGDRRIDGLHPHDIVVKGMSQVPQGRYVWPKMSVLDNLELGAITRNDRPGIKADLERVYSYFPRLKERGSSPAGMLSGGEQQMVAIGRALMARPSTLLMDEPSHGLAPRLVHEMVDTILRLKEEGMTILLIEQNIGIAAAVAGPAFVLANGEIAFESAGRDLANDPAVLRSYLGR